MSIIVMTLILCNTLDVIKFNTLVSFQLNFVEYFAVFLASRKKLLNIQQKLKTETKANILQVDLATLY